jgi:hypothetical protein
MDEISSAENSLVSFLYWTVFFFFFEMGALERGLGEGWMEGERKTRG